MLEARSWKLDNFWLRMSSGSRVKIGFAFYPESSTQHLSSRIGFAFSRIEDPGSRIGFDFIQYPES
jgi:hypothetical protein